MLRALWVPATLLLLSGCFDFSVDSYCRRFPELCSVRVDAITPHHAHSQLGTSAVLTGVGFDEDTRVWIGETPAEVREFVHPGKLLLQIAPGTPGCQPVRVESHAGTFVTDCAFWFDPLPRVEVISPMPLYESAPWIELRGAHLIEATVSLGGAWMRRVNPAADHLFRGERTQFSGAAGPLVVRNPYGEIQIPIQPVWERFPEVLPAAVPTELAVDGRGEGGAAARFETSGGSQQLYRLPPGGDTWEAIPVPAGGLNHPGMFFSPSGELYASPQGASTMVKLPPGGSTWLATDVPAYGRVISFVGGIWLEGGGAARNVETGEVLDCPPGGDCTPTCRAGEVFWTSWATYIGSAPSAGGLFRFDGTAWEEVASINAPGPGELGCDDLGAFAISGGVLRRYDNDPAGEHGRIVLQGATRFQVSAGSLIAETDAAVFGSTDRGITWSPLTSVPPYGRYAVGDKGLAVVAPSRASLGVGRLAALRPVSAGLPRQEWMAVVVGVHASPVDPHRVFARTRSELFRSTDGADSWSLVDPERFGFPTRIVWSAAAPSVLWIGSRAGLLRSADGGVSWEPIFVDESVQDVAVSATDADHLLIASRTGARESRDGGATWTRLPQLPSTLPPENVQLAFGTVLATSGDRVYRLEGSGWGVFVGGEMVNGFIADPFGDALVIVREYSSLLYRGEQEPQTLPTGTVAFVRTAAGTALLHAEQFKLSRLELSTGAVTTLWPVPGTIALGAHSAEVLYRADREAFYRSVNGGR